MFFSKKKTEKEEYYFDYAAATPIDDEVLSTVCGYLGENFANPGALHKAGLNSKTVIENSRKIIAESISAQKDEIVFTSGGTESDVLSLRGVLESYDGESKPHFIVSAIEHAAVFDTANQMKDSEEIELSILPVDEDGIVLVDELKNLVKENTILVSVMYVNNEIGSVQDIVSVTKEVRRLKKKIHGNRSTIYPLVHTDASQAVGLYQTGVLSLGIDLMSFNSGKIYGPKGVGALYVKRNSPIKSILYFGGQESGLRPGTEPVALIAGFAKALEKSDKEKAGELVRLGNLKRYFVDTLESFGKEKKFSDLEFEYKVNGKEDLSSPHILHVSFRGLESDQIVIELDARGVFVSSKSACKTLDPQTSHVLSAIGYRDNSWGSVRFSFGKDTDKNKIDFALDSLRETLIKLLHTKKTFSL